MELYSTAAMRPCAPSACVLAPCPPMRCRGAVVVCDALRPQDMAVVALGMMLAEQRGAFRRDSGDLGEI